MLTNDESNEGYKDGPAKILNGDITKIAVDAIELTKAVIDVLEPITPLPKPRKKKSI